MGDDQRLLTASPSLNVLYLLKLAWRGFDVRLLVSARQLTAQAASLEEQLELGIDLTKLTILVGAFTVGIGFGLQNVINNFVSGLILLFERPIKVGDVIDAGGNVGEVTRIGIRASVIRTADGSEIIVPNGALISSQVTNWTLSDRTRAVEVTVNVAGGVDPERVIELLKSTATAHPGVAKEPSPQVYVTSFSAGAVTFQLRAWTDRLEDWAQLRSDLSVAVKEALAHEEIPIA